LYKSEAKKEKQYYKKKEERDKQLMHDVKTWEEEILPNWHVKYVLGMIRFFWLDIAILSAINLTGDMRSRPVTYG
jgi:hypothetical protein